MSAANGANRANGLLIDPVDILSRMKRRSQPLDTAPPEAVREMPPPPTAEQVREMLAGCRPDGFDDDGKKTVGRCIKAALGAAAGWPVWVQWLATAIIDVPAKIVEAWPELDVGGLTEYSLRYLLETHALGVDDAEFERRTLNAKFNRLYSVVNDGGKAVVLEPKLDLRLNRTHYNRMSFTDLCQIYSHQRIEVSRRESDGEVSTVTKNVAKFWLDHPNRRTYLGGVVFDPSGRHTPPDTLNLWQGFAVEPQPGTWSKIAQHIYSVVCGGDEASFKYLICWMARTVQYPGQQGEVAVVLRGERGSGKGTLGTMLQRIFGQHALHISDPSHLTGNFNAHLRDCVVLFADEAFYAGDKKHLGAFKRLVTESTLLIEGKGQNAVLVPNTLHVIMASNEEWVVPAAIRFERRLFVLNVSDARCGDRTYFKALYEEMDNDGLAAMLHDLLSLDLDEFEVRDVPTTSGLQDQQSESMPTQFAWLQLCGVRGYVFESRLGLSNYFGQWHTAVSTELLYASYQAYAASVYDRRPLKPVPFGKFMTEMGFKPTKLTKAVMGEESQGGFAALRKHEGQATGRVLGTLAEFRARWVAATGLPDEWDDGGEAGVADRLPDEWVAAAHAAGGV